MGLRLSLDGISTLVLLAVSIPASAQDIFVTPIPGRPFSGEVKVERSRFQPDGSVVNLKTIRAIARDGRGRIRNEVRVLVPVSSPETPQITSVHLYDPQTRISTMLNPKERTFWTNILNHPPATIPPTLINASPTGNTLPQNEFTNEEDLGIRDMEGVPVHGVREIQTIPADNSGTGKDVLITDEYWYSDDLRLNLMIKHSDPRTGAVTMRVVQVTRTEPDPALFEIPDGYRRVGE